MEDPTTFVQLIQTVGLPMALLAVVSYVFLQMAKKQSDELSETHKWIREALIIMQKDTASVVARCETTLASLLNLLDKRDPEYREHE
jgi:hypothetical protein